MAENVQIKVRVQARGGKFLGPKVKAPELVVRVAGTTETLFRGTFDNSASGTVVATPAPTASRNAIVVQPSPTAEAYPAAGAYALDVPNDGASLIASFPLKTPAVVEFVATAYTTAPQVALKASAMMPLFPGTSLLDDPGLILTIPGLLVSNVRASYAKPALSVEANVEMMCGCPITPQPWSTNPPGTEPYWPSYEFEVKAYVAGAVIPLQCTRMNTFSGHTNVTLNAGMYEVAVVALQRAETNAGLAIGELNVRAS